MVVKLDELNLAPRSMKLIPCHK